MNKLPETLRKDFESWKTTAGGIAIITFGIYYGAILPLTDGDPVTGVDWSILGAALAMGFAAISARDADKDNKNETPSE